MPDTRRLMEDYLPIEAISTEASREKSIRLPTNDCYRGIQLGDSCWLYFVWDMLGIPDLEPLMIGNPGEPLDYANDEVGTARWYDISKEAVERALSRCKGERGP